MSATASASKQANFDRVARIYRWAEYLALGPLLQQTRTALLDRVAMCRHALLFGDGDGRFLARLLARSPNIEATAVDTSAAMLRLLESRCRRATPTAHLNTVQMPALLAPIPPAADLVVTHFFLDCLTQSEIDELARKLTSTLSPGTMWLVSDFHIPDTPVVHTAARLYIRFLYLAFRLLTGLRVKQLPDPQAALLRSGFERVTRRTKLFGLLYTELWVLRRSASEERHNPALPALIHNPMAPQTEAGSSPHTDIVDQANVADPLPDPEPIAPSLSEPDPGVFHHEPAGKSTEPNNNA